jgi:hypothetical protein
MVFAANSQAAAQDTSTTTITTSSGESERARSIRGLLLSANWTFGKPPKVHKSEDLVGPDAG